ncbi:MAG: ribosome silencing factor [Candidatus Izemoplasmatales bacterium]
MTEKLKRVYDALSDLKLKDIIIYDFQDFSPYFDYQVIATATSERQVHAAINHLKQALPEIESFRIEGATDNHWLLVDLGDIIVHVMHKDDRDYYQIEKLFFERKQVGK